MSALGKYDAVISLGGWCAPAANIRRYLGVASAYPFDWWVTPFRAIRAVIEDDFKGLFEEGRIEIVDSGASAMCKKYGILHHHDFERGSDGLVVADLEGQLKSNREKFQALGRRFEESVRGHKVLFIRENLVGADRKPGQTNQELLLDLHQYFISRWPASSIDLLLVDQKPDPADIHLRRGRIFSCDLGSRLDEMGFWERNWDQIFHEVFKTDAKQLS